MSKCIFIFDDDVDILEVCSITLETEGYKVVTASNCENILSKVAATTPDLIIMDNKIPDAGGIIASKTLKASSLFHQIPILFFSANSDVQQLAAEAQADLFMEKPFDLDELVAVVKRAIG